VILIIGALSPLTGGTSVSLFEYKAYLESDQRFVFFDSNSIKKHNRIKHIASLMSYFANASVISFHVSDHAATRVLPILYILSRLCFKRVIYRQFGGEFIETYKSLSKLKRAIVKRTILKSDVLYFQTKKMVDYFTQHVSPKSKIRWLPTSRINIYQYRCKSIPVDNINILYIGRVVKEKGIRELVCAVNSVEGFKLKIYGELKDDNILQLINKSPCCCYYGRLSREKISQALMKGDLFALPSYHPGEGYSGALIEAMFAGLPIIVSKWNAFTEMFSNDEVIFVTPGSTSDIKEKLIQIKKDPHILLDYSKRSYTASSRFNLEIVINEFIEDHLECAEL
jgi:glycosyltransferase involved in cell wall biosynthesis